MVEFAAHLAVQHEAHLILQHVIRPQDRSQILASHTLDDLEAQLMRLVPQNLQSRIAVRRFLSLVIRRKNCFYQAGTQQADLIVLGAQGASAFAAVTRNGVVYKVLAHSPCPVITLSPVVLAASGSKSEKTQATEAYMAGVF